MIDNRNFQFSVGRGKARAGASWTKQAMDFPSFHPMVYALLDWLNRQDSRRGQEIPRALSVRSRMMTLPFMAGCPTAAQMQANRVEPKQTAKQLPCQTRSSAWDPPWSRSQLTLERLVVLEARPTPPGLRLL